MARPRADATSTTPPVLVALLVFALSRAANNVIVSDARCDARLATA
jgi:hypothetical protein